MGFKRVHSRGSSSELDAGTSLSRSRSGSYSPPAGPPSAKKRRHAVVNTLQGLKIFVVPAKIDPKKFEEIVETAERVGAVICDAPEDAVMVVTSIAMRKRFERHIAWSIAKKKSIVTPDWLIDSAKAGKALPCGEYAALRDLQEETIANCPDGEDCPGCDKCRQTALPSLPSSPSQKSTSAGEPSWKGKEREKKIISSPPPPPTFSEKTGIDLKPAQEPTSDKIKFTSRFACCRASPLVCPNQALVEELSIIRRSRELEGESRSSLGYQRAIGTIKAYPSKFKFIKEAAKLPYIGDKIHGMIEEFLDIGEIKAAREIEKSQRYQSLSTFATVYGVGPVTARKLYDLGLRTIDDMKVYYEIDDDENLGNLSTSAGSEEDHGLEDADFGSMTETVKRIEADESNAVKIGLMIYRDLSVRISRNEAEEIARVIYAQLCEIEPGCAYTVVGGYRRGKSESNDVDIVFTHPEPGKDRGLCKKLVRKLSQQGMVTYLMHLSSFRSPNSLRKAHWDTLEKALTVFKLPDSSPRFAGDEKANRRLSRRVDLIFAPVEVYWCAVTGWTGSTMFERDIRLWTKQKCGWKFDSSGITRLSDSSPVHAKSELDLFKLCGLEWIDPTMRNADV